MAERASVFSGFGLFTAWDPAAAARAASLVDWVAYRPDLGKPNLNLPLYPWVDEGTKLVEPTSSPLIVQSEGPDQMNAAQAVEPLAQGPRALVGEPDYFLAGWTWLVEVYGVSCLDYGEALPVLGVGAYGPLANYFPLPAKYQGNFSIYLAEEMTESDWSFLERVRRSQARLGNEEGS